MTLKQALEISGSSKSHYSIFHFFLLILLLIGISYSNTITAAWHLDDIPNIVENEKLHITRIDTASIAPVFFAHPRVEGNTYRPVAYLSFALNWFFGADDVLGYHLVNICLHWLTACTLYLTIIQLLNTPALILRSLGSKHIIALSTSLLWALNPVQTQAVTYIVQRMSVLASLLFLTAILFYLIGRQSTQRTKKNLYFLLTLLCFILAIGSKENSITLPLVLLLTEWIFFRASLKMTGWNLLMGGGFFVIVGTAVYLIIGGDVIGSIAGYDQRSFSLEQRLLTESRILVFYLSLLFYPAPWRLSLVHDFPVSFSFIQPPTTALAIIFLGILTAWALWKNKSWPTAAFAVLFFLVNHIIESTIFPLELIFEHRNYLPSLFLFLPLTVALVDIHKSHRLQTVPLVHYTIIGVALLLPCLLAAATFTRNHAWQTEKTLWEDSLAKGPGQSRPYINLAFTYQQLGRNDEAFELCRQSLTKESPTPAKDRMRAYNSMGNIAMNRGFFLEAVDYYHKAIEAQQNEPSHYFLHKALLANGQPDEALIELERLITKHPKDNELLISLALVMVNQRLHTQAIVTLRSIADTSPNNSYQRISATLCLGSILSMQGNHQDALKLYQDALSITDPLLPLLCVIGNHLIQDNRDAAVAQLKELQKHYTSEFIIKNILDSQRHNILFPVKTRELANFVLQHSTPSSKTINGRLR